MSAIKKGKQSKNDNKEKANEKSEEEKLSN